MTKEFTGLTNELDSALFRYAHLAGALEFYSLVLEKPSLQIAVSKIISGTEAEWK